MKSQFLHICSSYTRLDRDWDRNWCWVGVKVGGIELAAKKIWSGYFQWSLHRVQGTSFWTSMFNFDRRSWKIAFMKVSMVPIITALSNIISLMIFTILRLNRMISWAWSTTCSKFFLRHVAAWELILILPGFGKYKTYPIFLGGGWKKQDEHLAGVFMVYSRKRASPYSVW